MLLYLFALIVLGIMLALFFGESLRYRIASWLFETNRRFWFLPVLILCVYLAAASFNRSWKPGEFLILAVYFFYPVFSFRRKKAQGVKATLFDAILVLAVWLPQEFGLVDVRWMTIGHLPIPIGVFATVALLLLLLTYDRSLELNIPGKNGMA